MNIGFDAKRALLNHSGLGNYARNLIGALLDHYPGNEYHLYSPKSNPTDQKELQMHSEKNLFFHFPQNIFLKKAAALWRTNFLSKDISRDKINIYHGLSHELPIGIQNSSAQSIVTIHDLIFERYPKYYPVTDRFFYRNKIKHACRVANSVVAISEQTKSDLVTLYSIDPNKIEVIFQGFDSIYLDKQKNDLLLDKFLLPEHFALCVGTFSERKRHLAVLHAYLKIKDTIKEKLVFVGKGGDKFSEVNDFIKSHHLENDVIILSDCDKYQLRQIYLRSSLLIYPSEFEGFGIPILEAFASDIPVLTNDKAVFREAGGDAAFYVDTQNHDLLATEIKSILENHHLCVNHIEKGRKQIENFNESAIATKMMNLYKKLYKE